MHRTDHASLSVTEHALASLAAVYEQAGIGLDDLDSYSTVGWFQTLAANCLQPSEEAVALAADGVVLPLRIGPMRLGPLRGRRARGLSNFYSCRFTPPGLERSPEAVRAVAAFGRHLRNRGLASLWFDALDEGPKATMVEGLQAAGWLVEPFPQFGNWYLPAEGLAFERYWQQRPGALRNTGRRGYRRLIEKGDGAIVCHAEPGAAAAAIWAYETVYAQSWQAAEPFPDYMPNLIRHGLAAGEAQVWCLLAGGRPVAAQIWLRRQDRATIFKLAYDRDWGRQSVGTVLTMAAMRAALSDTGIREIDFGWGDDPYKQEWLPERRQRYGVAAYNLRTLTGTALAVRNLGAKKFRGLIGIGNQK